MAERAPEDGPRNPEEMWDAMVEASEDLGDELGLAPPFRRAALDALDRWVSAHDAALGDDELARLGLFLARFVVDAHDGGLARIEAEGHPLVGEWAATGFRRGLAPDYHVPFMISAVRIGADRTLTARRWYEQLLAEGRAGKR
jgi:hypothetical protein